MGMDEAGFSFGLGDGVRVYTAVPRFETSDIFLESFLGIEACASCSPKVC